MSLFIGSLALENPTDDQSFAAPIRLGALTGSILSGVFGYVLVRFGSARRPEEMPHERQSREA